MNKWLKVLALGAVLVAVFSATLLASWESDVRLTSNSAASRLADNNAKSICERGDTVHVVWGDFRVGSHSEIYYKRSTNGGQNWDSDVLITTNDSSDSYSPAISVSFNYLNVAFEDLRNSPRKEIYSKTSSNRGATWTTEQRRSSVNGSAENPSIASSGDYVHLTWTDSRNKPSNSIYYRRSTNNGYNWQSEVKLTNADTMSTLKYSSVAAYGCTVHVVWEDDRNGNPEIYYIRSTDNGANWGSETRLTNNNSASKFPSVAAAGSNVYVVWQDSRDGNDEIYYLLSTNGGDSWAADYRLTNSSGNSWQPTVAIFGASLVHVVWDDDRDSNWEIYYRKYDSGWGSETRLTNNSSSSRNASIAVAGGVHVVWKDFRDSNDEIYYKRDPSGNTSGSMPSAIGEDAGPSQIGVGVRLAIVPNPFAGKAALHYSLTKFGPVSLAIYGVNGQKVRTLVAENASAGTHEISWDGRDEFGKAVGAGVYFARFAAEGVHTTQRVTVLR